MWYRRVRLLRGHSEPLAFDITDTHPVTEWNADIVSNAGADNNVVSIGNPHSSADTVTHSVAHICRMSVGSDSISRCMCKCFRRSLRVHQRSMQRLERWSICRGRLWWFDQLRLLLFASNAGPDDCLSLIHI